MDPSRRVLHVVTRSDWGGAARVVRLLATRTSAETAVACGPGGRLIRELRADGVPVHVLSSLQSPPSPVGDVRSLAELVRLFRRVDPDLVHLHSTKAGLLGRLVARIVDVPAIFTVHGWGFYNTEYDRFSDIVEYGERALSRLTAQYVCVSENDFDEGVRRAIVDDDSATVVHNGIPPLSPDVDRPTLSDVCGISDDTPVVGAVARFAPQKNPTAFVELATRLREGGFDAPFVFIGDGPLREDCVRMANERGLENIYFPGFRDDALDLLYDFDVFVLPSRFEGFPLSVLESLHAGVPVVAYGVGGVPEALDEGKTGYVVTPGDIDTFTSRVRSLLEHDVDRRQMQAVARETARERFSADRMVAEYETVYDDVLTNVGW